MILKALGFKRILILSILLGVFAVLTGAYYTILVPQEDDTRRQLGGLRSEISTLQAETDKLKADFDYFESQRDVFERMNAMGFFAGQDRVKARERFDSIQKLSKIISARYEIRAANMMAEEKVLDPYTGLEVDPGPYVVMESPITVTLAAIDDLDIYRFIYFLNYGYPGLVTITSVNIARKISITPEVLKLIGQKTPPEIVMATVSMIWRTMSNRDAMSNSGEALPMDFNAALGAESGDIPADGGETVQ